MKRLHGPAALALSLALAACQSAAVKPPPAATLGRNALACRSPETVAALQAAGQRFQRVADNEMASGSCQVFQASHPVRDKQVDRGLLRFVDPAGGRVYWAYPAS